MCRTLIMGTMSLLQRKQWPLYALVTAWVPASLARQCARRAAAALRTGKGRLQHKAILPIACAQEVHKHHINCVVDANQQCYARYKNDMNDTDLACSTKSIRSDLYILLQIT